ncbi:MAG: HNH endonuclease [Actinomycetota bacterium]|nr:HNH endonuclease [Actinomycetota bacterium]
MTGRALVLNATFEPLCVVSSRRALVLVLDEKAELVHDTGAEFRSERARFPEPSVVRLSQYVRIPHQTRIAISRRSVFARDGHRCQYCGAQAENIDHVVPRSRGGPHSWENVVASCRRCNASKEDYLLEEAGFVLRSAPRAPRSRVWLLAASGEMCAEWEPYVAPVLERSAGRHDPAA